MLAYSFSSYFLMCWAASARVRVVIVAPAFFSLFMLDPAVQTRYSGSTSWLVGRWARITHRKAPGLEAVSTENSRRGQCLGPCSLVTLRIDENVCSLFHAINTVVCLRVRVESVVKCFCW